MTTVDEPQDPIEDLALPASFADLDVIPEIVRALSEAGIEHPFPIQDMAIPIALTGADLIGQARTGTGKTLAFGIPILQHVLLDGDEDFAELVKPGKPQALVMTPTRELAMQVASDLRVAAKYRPARILTIYGGVGYDDQLAALKSGVDVVVGTPGRLLDLVNRRDLDLSQVRTMVLDEADEMLDLGFLPDVERLVSKTSPSRQSLLFSATMPAPIIALARSNMHQPVHVRAEGRDAQVTVPDTRQFIYQAHDLDKAEILGKLLQSTNMDKMMVFTRTKRAAQRIADELEDRGFAASSIHGDLNQGARERALKRFRANQLVALVATDVAARGIDVTGVSHVVNYEVPDDAKAYVHRIGRTGRAGNKGVAITLVDWRDITRWKVINKTLELPFFEPVETYSTSPHLFSDLEIPEDVKGRIAEPKPKPREASSDELHSGRDRGRGDRGARTSQPRPSRSAGQPRTPATSSAATEGDQPKAKRTPTKRPRTRTRNGNPVSGEPTGD